MNAKQRRRLVKAAFTELRQAAETETEAQLVRMAEELARNQRTIEHITKENERLQERLWQLHAGVQDLRNKQADIRSRP